MSRHNTYAYSRIDVIDGLIHQACCTCGWEGPESGNATVADMGARRHDEEHNNRDGERE